MAVSKRGVLKPKKGKTPVTKRGPNKGKLEKGPKKRKVR